jgi:hypothetical protein
MHDVKTSTSTKPTPKTNLKLTSTNAEIHSAHDVCSAFCHAFTSQLPVRLEHFFVRGVLPKELK